MQRGGRDESFSFGFSSSEEEESQSWVGEGLELSVTGEGGGWVEEVGCWGGRGGDAEGGFGKGVDG